MSRVVLIIEDKPDGNINFVSTVEQGDGLYNGVLSPAVETVALIRALGEAGVLSAIAEVGSAHFIKQTLDKRKADAGEPVPVPAALPATDVVRALLMLGLFDRIGPLVTDYVEMRRIAEAVAAGKGTPVEHTIFGMPDTEAAE